MPATYRCSNSNTTATIAHTTPCSRRDSDRAGTGNADGSGLGKVTTLRDESYEITDLVHGDTITEVLNYVQFDAQTLVATFRRKIQKARLPRQEANTFIADYIDGLAGYTYLEGEIAE